MTVSWKAKCIECGKIVTCVNDVQYEVLYCSDDCYKEWKDSGIEDLSDFIRSCMFHK